MIDDYRRILGVSADVSPAELKAAFRKLAHRYHPDVSSEANATEKFIELVTAYRALTAEVKNKAEFAFKKTAGKRNAKVSSAADKPATERSAAQSSNVDREKQSQRVKAAAMGSSKGKDCHIDAHISVEELYWGVELKVNPSAVCLGRRTQKGKHNSALLKILIPRGTRNGARLRVRGKGEAGKNGGEAGDIYITVRVKPHERYEIVDDDIYVDMPLSRWEAAEGAMIDLVTPAGRIEVDVPAGISGGQSVRVPGRGLPRAKSASGNLFAVTRLVNASVRTEHLHKWPHMAHANSARWRPVGGRHGNIIDVHI